MPKKVNVININYLHMLLMNLIFYLNLTTDSDNAKKVNVININYLHMLLMNLIVYLCLTTD